MKQRVFKLSIKKLAGTIFVSILCLSFYACLSVANNSPPQNLVQIMDGATTRGGFTVTGPVVGGEHGWAFGEYYGDISKLGYVEEEYFIEGVAQRYEPVGKLGKDGKWYLQANSTAPYKTRFIVRRPINPDKFNGTVVMEWTNVSGGFEISLLDNPGIYTEGFAYVAVSAQVNGLTGFKKNPQGLIPWDTERYSSLNIPDDGLSYDIFTQVARAVNGSRPKDGIDPMNGLEVKKMFAMGESQSGGRVLSYTNGVQPIEKLFDGIIMIVNAGRGNDFLGEPAHIKNGGKVKVRNVTSRVRVDINHKAFIINSQTESLFLGKIAQPDSKNIRSLQIPGSAHAAPTIMKSVADRAKRDGITNIFSEYSVSDTNVVDWTYVLEAVLVQIQNWIDKGKEPPTIPRIESNNILFGYKKDKYNNVKGGVKLPELEVPIAHYFVDMIKTGLGGYRIFFTDNELLKLYPSHQDYVNKVIKAARSAEETGIILPYRAEQYINEAEASSIPYYSTSILDDTK